MASPQSGATGDGSKSLYALISDAGRMSSDRIDGFVRMASVMQDRRRQMRATDVDGITRTVGLLVLMELDPEIRHVLENCGLDYFGLEAVLSLRGGENDLR
jgi:hypothetical protein